MNREERRAYNAMKQQEYRRKKRGEPRKYTKGLGFLQRFMTTEQIFGAEGHCSQCGMRLDAEFHKQFPCNTHN